MRVSGPIRAIGAASLAMIVLDACTAPRQTAGETSARVAAPEAVADSRARTPMAGTDDRDKAGGVTIATWQRPVPNPGVVGSAAALASGTLILRNNCLLLEWEGGRTILPVFPSDRIQWDAAALTLTHEGRRYRVGDPISIGGGGVRRDSPAVAAIAEIDARCGADSVWFVGG